MARDRRGAALAGLAVATATAGATAVEATPWTVYGLWLAIAALIAAGVLAGLTWRARRRPGRAEALDARLDRLRAQQDRLHGVAHALALPAERAEEAEELRIEAAALADELADVAAAIATRQLGDAELGLASAARRLELLEAGLTAAVADLASLAGEQAEVCNRSAAARSRLGAMRGVGVGENGLAILADRLAAAERQASADPAAALALVDGVQRALDRLEARAGNARPRGSITMAPPAAADDSAARP